MHKIKILILDAIIFLLYFFIYYEDMTLSQLHILLCLIFSVFEWLHTFMCTMYAWNPWRPEEAFGSLGTRGPDGCEPVGGLRESN